MGERFGNKLKDEIRQVHGTEVGLSDSNALVMLPCPLCGSEPDLVDIAGWEIWCKCGLGLVLENPDKDDLVKHWNIRST